jgi:hypothetical protein
MRRQVFVSGMVFSLVAVLAGGDGCGGSDRGPIGLPSGPTGPTASPAALPTSAGVGLTGSYTLTLIASPSCAMVTDWITHQALPFPDSVRVRHYNAEFTGASGVLTPVDGPAQQISIGGIDHYVYNGSALLSVTNGVLQVIVPPDAEDLARRNDALLDGGPTCSGGDYWWESVSSTEVFDTCGTWRASVDDPTRIAGTIDGAFGYYNYKGVALPAFTTDLFCRAKDHQFTLTKR